MLQEQFPRSKTQKSKFVAIICIRNKQPKSNSQRILWSEKFHSFNENNHNICENKIRIHYVCALTLEYKFFYQQLRNKWFKITNRCHRHNRIWNQLNSVMSCLKKFKSWWCVESKPSTRLKCCFLFTPSVVSRKQCNWRQNHCFTNLHLLKASNNFRE